jgi:hypothetical protein
MWFARLFLAVRLSALQKARAGSVRLFVEGGIGDDCQQAQNFFALAGTLEHEAHAHPKPGMNGLHLTPDSQLRFGSADDNLHARSAGKRVWHFDVTTVLADIGQSAAIGDVGAEMVDFGSEFAGETWLAAAVAGMGEEGGTF